MPASGAIPKLQLRQSTPSLRANCAAIRYREKIFMASEHTIELTDANFDAEVMQSVQPVLVDFWGENCPPCRAIGPMIDEIAGEYAGRVKVGKLELERGMSAAMRFNVSHIPTLVVVKNGEVVSRFLGIPRKKDLTGALEGALA